MKMSAVYRRIGKIRGECSVYYGLALDCPNIEVWCKTIVPCYIKSGSYNSFAPIPRYTVTSL